MLLEDAYFSLKGLHTTLTFLSIFREIFLKFLEGPFRLSKLLLRYLLRLLTDSKILLKLFQVYSSCPHSTLELLPEGTSSSSDLLTDSIVLSMPFLRSMSRLSWEWLSIPWISTVSFSLISSNSRLLIRLSSTSYFNLWQVYCSVTTIQAYRARTALFNLVRHLWL